MVSFSDSFSYTEYAFSINIEVELMKAAICGNDLNVVEVFGRYATTIIENAFMYEFYQDPKEMHNIFIIGRNPTRTDP